jgi:hypothetical protein
MSSKYSTLFILVSSKDQYEYVSADLNLILEHCPANRLGSSRSNFRANREAHARTDYINGERRGRRISGTETPADHNRVGLNGSIGDGDDQTSRWDNSSALTEQIGGGGSPREEYGGAHLILSWQILFRELTLAG